MARTVSDTFREQFSAESTGEVALVWLEITHSTLAAPIRLVLDMVSHGFGKTSTATTLFHDEAAVSSGLLSFHVADHANFAVGDDVRVEETSSVSHAVADSLVAAGATVVPVVSASGLSVQDHIKILLNDGTYDHRKILKISGTNVTIDEGLTSATQDNAIHRTTSSYGRIGALTVDGTSDVITLTKPASHAFPGGSTGGLVWKQNQFLPFPFEISLGNDEPGQFIGARLSIDNIDRAILNSFRAITPTMSAPEVTIRMSLADTPDRVEFETPPLAWRKLTYNLLKVDGELAPPTFFTRTYPAKAFTPSAFPNLFSV